MTLRLYDTATRSVREFVPRVPGQVGIYLCGLTVQSGPHIGHLRSGVNYDVLRRWFLHGGYQVTFIRNITDIDDKILVKAVEQDQPFWSIAYANERLLSDAYLSLGVLPPTYEPRATGHIPEMHALIQKLIDDGHAYPADDGSGDVYFDVHSYGDYGALSGRRPDAMLAPEEGPERAKRDARDFALWKGVKPGEPDDAYWPSPWGRGRPGWHIECSAMCMRYLGAEFDIHGGGLDLIFPHHENEVAQSRAAGLPFARHWVHHALLNLGGYKMAKSVGNVIDVAAVVAMGIRPVELRYYLATPHYRSIIDYTAEALREAAVAYRRIEGFVLRAAERLPATQQAATGNAATGNATSGTAATGSPTGQAVAAASGPAAAGGSPGQPAVSGGSSAGHGAPGEVPAAFAAAMDDDLNTSAALAVLHETVREGNAALAAGDDRALAPALAAARAMLGVLGLDPLAEPWRGEQSGGDLHGVVDSLVALALEQRGQARARKDWAAADAVRDQLKQAGIVVEDTPTGPRWTVEDR